MLKQNSFNPITLSFYDKLLEKEFIKEYADRSVKIVRIGLSLGSITFIFVGLMLDKKFLVDDPYILLPWRIAGGSFMIATVILLLSRSVRQHFQPLLLFGLTVVAITIMKTAITYHESGWYNPSIAITGFIIFIHTLSRVRFLYSTIFTWIFIIIYIVLMFNIAMPDGLSTQPSIFFIVINIFGMSASYGIEFNIRDAFLKSKQLQTSQHLLEVENKRKSEELESVKKLQLSMLPEKAPSPGKIDVAFHMSTATEVGGDYCDYVYGDNNTLTFAIGDATGHGAKASAMVMGVKILFTEYAANMSISDFLRHASSTIKSLKLPKLFMTLAFGRISGNTLKISGAGIPAALLYKTETKRIEHISLKGIPLGTFVVSDYEEKEFSLAPGDIVVLMTDGVTELQNTGGQMYDTNLIEEQLIERSKLPSQEIINHLVSNANSYRGEEPLHDDMTLLVLKING
ncbi:MAG: PP2C family protein-serine/threonine phosphatase [Ignavibacteriaceae bacterium]